MMKLARFLRRRGRAVAAVEFAIAAPVMLAFLGGVVDFGLAYYDQSRVGAGVGAGAEYALLNYSTVLASPATAQSTTIPNLVKSASGLTGMTVTVTGLSPAVCYCVSSGPPPSVTAQSSCSATCSNGAPAGYYVFITGSYTYHAMLPGYSHLANPTITETATVQIK
jgi:Flp pilus assembly protein TadG